MAKNFGLGGIKCCEWGTKHFGDELANIFGGGVAKILGDKLTIFLRWEQLQVQFIQYIYLPILLFLYISGIVNNLGDWRQARRFALHSMRDFGLGKHSIDERIQDEAGVLVEQFRSKNGRPFDPTADITKAVSNIICSITFGKRLVI